MPSSLIDPIAVCSLETRLVGRTKFETIIDMRRMENTKAPKPNRKQTKFRVAQCLHRVEQGRGREGERERGREAREVLAKVTTGSTDKRCRKRRRRSRNESCEGWLIEAKFSLCGIKCSIEHEKKC